jgi:DNA-binding PadR family transcriptional regulator
VQQGGTDVQQRAAGDIRLARSAPQLTDDEATFLALLARAEPATAYQLSRIYEDSPVSNFGTSKGKIYPLVRRLKERELIRGKPVSGDKRGSETLWCTAKGRAAIRSWIKQIRPTHLLVEDPLRTMVQSFNLLDKDEQLEWVRNAKAGLTGKMAEVRAYHRQVSVPFHDLVYENALLSLRTRLKWLEQLEQAIEAAP